MQDIIKKILEIDNMAQKMTEEARALKKEAEASVEHDIQILREKYIAKARHRIEITTQTESKFLNEALEDIDKKYSLVADKLNGSFQENEKQWVDQLYNRVIGG